MYHLYTSNFQQIWERIAQEKNNVNDLDSLEDTPWTLSSIGEMLAKGEHEIYSGKLNLEAVIGPVIRLGQPYLPNSNKSITSDVTSTFMESIISRVRHPALHACFKNTRLERNMIRIIDDFAAEKVDKPTPYQIHSFPLILERDSHTALKGIKEYYAEVGVTSIEFEARSVRDAILNGYIFSCAKGYDIADLSIAASAMCLLFCTDYLNIYDGSNFGTRNGFYAALTDSITLCSGGSYAPIMGHVVINAAILDYKNHLTATALNNVVLERIRANPMPTPLEYLEVRWLDAFLAIHIKFPLVLADGAGIPLDARLNPDGIRICPYIRRCLDLFIHNNDIIDLISDSHGEPLNSVSVAARYGGRNAVVGYADACATCVDDCAKCDCDAGDAAHDWAVDLVQGILTTYELVPRFVAMTQMAEMSHLTSQVYKELINSSQHGAFTTGKVAKFHSNIPGLHDTDWKPLYNMETVPPYGGSGECGHCETIATWLLNRERKDGLENTIRDFVKAHVHLNPCPEMNNFWGEVLTLLAGEKFPSEIVQECARVVDSTWKLLRLAGGGGDVFLISKRQIRHYFDVCEVVTRTHDFPQGYHLRRAVVGLISLMGDRTDVSVFQRILDGLLEHSAQGDG